MPAEVTRYSCQLKLPDFGGKTQRKLQRAKVLIVGAGGLGCPAAQYLVAAGIGTVAIVDHDTVSMSNLHRQILFTDKDVGLPKAAVAAKRLQQQNPEVTVLALPNRVTVDNVMEVIAPYDIVADCTDNFDTRFLLNDACVLVGKPLVYGAAYQYEGHVSVWNVSLEDGTRSSHYRDAFPSADAKFIPDCSSGGVLPMLTGVIGCMQASEVVKYLADLPGLLANCIFILDAQTMQSRIIHLPSSTRTTVSRLQSPALDEVPTISIADFRQDMASQKYQLIDVRTPDEHKQFNIGGDNIPLAQLLTGASDLNFSKPIVFYCQSGVRSTTAVRYILDAHANRAVMSLAGGIEAWQMTDA